MDTKNNEALPNTVEDSIAEDAGRNQNELYQNPESGYDNADEELESDDFDNGDLD